MNIWAVSPLLVADPEIKIGGVEALISKSLNSTLTSPATTLLKVLGSLRTSLGLRDSVHSW